MELIRLVLDGHRSVEDLEFDAAQLTVLFGKNNAGKTNILETIAGVLGVAGEAGGAARRSFGGRGSNPNGGAVVRLEPGVAFDDAVLAALAPDSAAKTENSTVTFVNEGVVQGDISAYRDEVNQSRSWSEDAVTAAPRLHVLHLDWKFEGLDERVEVRVAELGMTKQARSSGDSPWLEYIRTQDGLVYQVPSAIDDVVRRLSMLATDLLPDFVDGDISTQVTVPTLWEQMPKVHLEYQQRGLTQCADLVRDAGSGAARWMSAAVDIALHLMGEYPNLSSLQDIAPGHFAGHVLLIDEPEAHLHPFAVASVVRWCHRMVRHGFTIIVATHHEEFLRASGEHLKLVHVTRDEDLVNTDARPLTDGRTARLQELARDIGLHPATALSLHRAILFVEGPLDVAVLDAYAGVRLDAAGVKVLPIHGTKNIEGLVAYEVVHDLEIKIGVLTDATTPETMAERSRKKQSSEEKKVLRILKIAEERGLPIPEAFGVPEDDLLFALPVEAIRAHLNGPFPEWKDLQAECRAALGKSPSDSVNWKAFAEDNYNLPIASEDGVWILVRHLIAADVELPSVEKVVKLIVAWANRAEGEDALFN